MKTMDLLEQGNMHLCFACVAPVLLAVKVLTDRLLSAAGNTEVVTVLKHTFKKGGDEEKDSLQPVRACINLCMSLTTYFKHSGLQLHLTRIFKPECETHWNTKLTMVESALCAFDDV